MPPDASDPGAESTPRLEVRLLGSVELVLDGQHLRSFDSLRLQRFIALIALRQTPQHRSKLAFELWPDSDERQARTNLRKLLHDLRHSLPDVDAFVDIDGETVQWIPSGPSGVDAVRFRDALAAGDLELAVRLYRGDLLPACYDDFILEERERLRDEARGAFGRLMEQAVGRGEHQVALRHARRVLDLSPTDEAAVRVQIGAHLALGDRAAGLRSYHRHAEVLERELAVPPSAAIRALYRELRAGAFESDDARGEDAPSAAEPPFVGRARERAQLDEAWSAARVGRAQLLLLTGEPGIGKSRLARELGRRVSAEGHVVAAARAYEAAGRLPWGPVIDLLRSEALRRSVDALEAGFRAELARLLPEHREPSRTSESSSTGDTTRRHRLFDAVTRVVVAGDRPSLLILDDLQWCDGETIEWVGFLVRSQPTAPVLVVGTVRSEEIPQQSPLSRVVDALAHDRVVTTVSLDRLDEATTAALAARLHADGAIEPELAARLWAETEGNPLFVIEALRAGFTSDGNRDVLTPTIRAVLGARLGQLSEEARRLTEVAAVIGRPFTVELLLACAELEEGELVDLVDELWRRRIIRDQGHAYDFGHDKLRAVALELVGPARRRRLHRTVAAALTAELGADAATSPRLAAHYDQAGMAAQAIATYQQAGSRAVAVSALEEAAHAFRRALELLAELTPSRDRDALELDLRIALGSPFVALEGYGSRGAHQLYERALALCRKLGQPVDAPVLRGLGLARLQGCRFDESDELARALLDEEHDEPIARTEGRYLLGVGSFWRGDLARARQHLEGALEEYDASRRDEHLASYAQDPRAVCLVRLALVELWAGDPTRADATARTALTLAADLDHLMTRGYVLTYAAVGADQSGDVERLSALLAEAEHLWKRLSEHYLVVLLDALRGWLEVQGGSAGGIERILTSVERSRVEGETLHLTYTLLLLARARGRLGEVRDGRAVAREALAASRAHEQRYLEAELLRVEGELAYRCGEREAAADALRAAVEVARAQGASWMELRALHSRARCFPEPASLEQLGELLEALPSGRELPAFRAAREFLTESR